MARCGRTAVQPAGFLARWADLSAMGEGVAGEMEATIVGCVAGPATIPEG